MDCNNNNNSCEIIHNQESYVDFKLNASFHNIFLILQNVVTRAISIMFKHSIKNLRHVTTLKCLNLILYHARLI